METINILSYICHQLPDRTLTIDGQLLPLCARCTGIYSGFMLGYMYQIVTLRNTKKFPSKRMILLLLAGIGVTAIDGLGEKVQLWNLSNEIRLFLGLICGSSISALLFPLFNFYFIRQSSLAAGMAARHYIVFLLLAGLFFILQNFAISYYVYKILSIAGLWSIYVIANSTFAGMIYRINTKMKNRTNMVMIFLSVLILMMTEAMVLRNMS